jgi:predicted RNA-binding Zn-ribbon protein involved in translation (DUF1610 family)
MLSSNLTHASSRAISRPPCPKCGATMVLARIAPHTPGYDIRTFDRPACERSFGKLGGAFRGVGSDSCEAVMILRPHECRAHQVTCVRLGADPDISVRGEASTPPCRKSHISRTPTRKRVRAPSLEE